jgi:hypothetical protein
MTKYNFKDHVSGDTFNGVEFEMLNNDVAINLTNCAIKIQIKPENKGASVLTKNVGSGITITGPSLGVFRLDSFVCSLPAGYYDYDIQFTFPSGVIKTYISGKWRILKQITK